MVGGHAGEAKHKSTARWPPLSVSLCLESWIRLTFHELEVVRHSPRTVLRGRAMMLRAIPCRAIFLRAPSRARDDRARRRACGAFMRRRLSHD